MNCECEIFQDGTVVGQASIRRTGLYYHFRCKCRFVGRDIHILRAKCGEHEVYLGICVPEGDCFSLSARIPVKQLGEGSIAITAHLRDAQQPHIEAVAKSEVRLLEKLEDLDRAYLHQGEVFIKD